MDLYDYIHTYAVFSKNKHDVDNEVNVHFGNVAVKDGADAATLKKLMVDYRHWSVDFLNGEAYSYLDLMACTMTRDFALTLIGLGGAVGLWRVITPENVAPNGDGGVHALLARVGLVGFQYEGAA